MNKIVARFTVCLPSTTNLNDYFLEQRFANCYSASYCTQIPLFVLNFSKTKNFHNNKTKQINRLSISWHNSNLPIIKWSTSSLCGLELNLELALAISLSFHCAETRSALFSFQMQPDARWRPSKRHRKQHGRLNGYCLNGEHYNGVLRGNVGEWLWYWLDTPILVNWVLSIRINRLYFSPHFLCLISLLICGYWDLMLIKYSIIIRSWERYKVSVCMKED